MSFSLSPVAAFKAEVLKEATKAEAKLRSIDINHDGISDVEEARTHFESGFAKLKALEAKVPPDKIAAALDLLFPGVFTADEIKFAEGAVDEIFVGVELISGVAHEAPKAVQ